MTMRECYAEFGGNYEEALRHLLCEERVRRYLIRFLNDPTAAALWCALEAGQREAALIAAHSLKGLSGCLGLSRLYASSCALTDALRETAANSAGLSVRVRRDYEETVHAVEELREVANHPA